jgi:rhodanese-related sulfurtransferase
MYTLDKCNEGRSREGVCLLKEQGGEKMRMMRNMLVVLTGFFVLFNFVSPLAAAESAVPKDEKKHTTLGKYATASEAYDMWKANPDKVKILDCRTAEEYAYVGHAPMAHNIPSRFWTGKWDAEKKDFVLDENPEFENEVKKRFKPDDTILIMCRSGHRSAASVNRLAKAGFTDVYNIVDGFEGDKITEEGHPNKGKRMKDGWRNSGAPWTYDLDPELIYTREK